MPFLRRFNDPSFQFRAECVEALRQMLEVRHFIISLNADLIISKGLEFMHEHNVAHRCGPLSPITRWLIVNGSGMLAEGILWWTPPD
jgi:hypothetical protein